ncbi:MAG: helix-turn-helix transcriptional regulator [Bacteroidia bacterium]|nr:helix-turn-helix transcriptional regulator [Bacteroidia bacterium]
MKLYIKFMVSLRCKMVVKDILEQVGIPYLSVELGEVNTCEELTAEQLKLLKERLKCADLELMDDKKAQLIEKIKGVIIEMIHYEEELPKVKFSVYLSEKLNHNYTYLANLFSETEGTTIEHFMILHKIEKVKELIMYSDLNLSEIAWKLHYSSVAHLSHQFKKVTGLTPSFFKKLKNQKRKSINDV